MSRVVLVEYVSLDGVIQAPGHAGEDPVGFAHGGWSSPFFAEHRRYMADVFARAAGFLLGRVTYEIFAAYWPTVTADDDDIAGPLNRLPKYVASTTLGEAEWTGTTVLHGDVLEEVVELKAQPGKDLVVVGSAELTQTLMAHDLVDEYQLWVHPIVLGSGKRIFRERSHPTPMELVDATTTARGLVILTYVPAGQASHG